MSITLTTAQLRTIAEEATKASLADAFTVLITPQGDDDIVAFLTEDGTSLTTVTVFADGSIASGWMAS